MEKSKTYKRAKFPPEVVREAYERFLELKKRGNALHESRLSTSFENERWGFDNDSEFFAEYRKNIQYAEFIKNFIYSSFRVYLYPSETTVWVSNDDRSIIQEVFEVFESHLEESITPLPPSPKEEPVRRPVIFIGHGRDPQWRDLKDHLREKHGYDVEAYEIGERAGHAVRDILEEMMDESSFALLVMTGEDETAEGTMRARQNVIHEAGLFQGRLGFSRAIILLEEGTEEFSNIHGIQQIRFSKGNIKETFGDVLATLRRELVEEES